MTCLDKITFHWTAGTSFPCAEDIKHYHFIIDSNGILYKGLYTPEDNLNCTDKKYAQHCGGGNTGNIGIAFCGCYVRNKEDVRNSKYPLTRIQLERGFELCAQLCKKYNIKIDNVLTHYEFGKLHPKSSSAGKIDITYLAPFPLITAEQCGSFIRSKVKWYLQKIS